MRRGSPSIRPDRPPARPPAPRASAPEPADPVEVGRVDAPAGALPPELTLAGAIDLATMGVRPGDEVWVSALGRDVFAEATGDHDDRAARSPVRRLRIIDETAFINQIRGELAGVRRAAIEIDREQADLQSRLTDPALELTDDELVPSPTARGPSPSGSTRRPRSNASATAPTATHSTTRP